MRVLEFYKLYRNLTVDLVDGVRIHHVNVNEYRNAKDYFSEVPVDNISVDHDVTEGMSAWGKLQGQIRKNGKSIGTQRYEVSFERAVSSNMIRVQSEAVHLLELGPSYWGKGSPFGIAKTLRFAAAFGLVKPTLSDMNNYCRDYIGLDCNGFVGNYLKHEGLGNLGPSHKVSAFAPAGSRVSKMTDIRAGSVLVWTSGGHVAIVDEVDGFCRADGTVHAMVAESTGSRLDSGDEHTDGLNYTEYVFQSVKDKVFKARRGIGKGKGASSVYVANFF